MGLNGRAERILLVDDNPALLRNIERILRLEGFEVLVAETGEQALEKLETCDPLPGLIISDVMMPGMDGFELFETIRERPEWLMIYFLFLTARDQESDLVRAYQLGAEDYLVKPVDQERLLVLIRSKLLRRREVLAALEAQKSALNEAGQQLAMMVAHELRTPLMSVSMVADMLSRELVVLEDDQLTDMLGIMQSGSLRLTRLIQQMVMYVQLQSGALGAAIEKRLRPNQFRDVVIGGVDKARQYAPRQNHIPVRFEEHTQDAPIRGDMESLQHALAEVLTNAMLFSPPDGVIFARLWTAENHAWVCVADHGPGIPEPELPRVFDPFYQVNRRRFEQPGIGIGLTLAKGIVSTHQGLLEMQSSVDHGTEVRIGLPLHGD